MRDGKKYRIINIVIDADNNPATWTENKLNEITHNEEVIGYFMKRTNKKDTINLYTLPNKYCKDNYLTLDDLFLAYGQWLIAMRIKDNEKLVKFHNPPIQNWLDTKEQWIKKTANKLSKTFDKPFDEMLSHVHYAIIKAFSKDNVYVGNLGYIERSAYNEVLMELRNNKNKLLLDYEKVISLDDDYEIDGTTHTLNDICGEDDPAFAEADFNETKNEITKVLSYTFSAREIDQIINSQGQLPLNLYRRLLAWRKTHSRGDFNVN